MLTRVQSRKEVYNTAMETIEQRVKEAQARIVPILNELSLDITARAYIDEEGKTRAKPIYINAAPKAAEDVMDAAQEMPKTIDQAIAEETLEANK